MRNYLSFYLKRIQSRSKKPKTKTETKTKRKARINKQKNKNKNKRKRNSGKFCQNCFYILKDHIYVL
ncbi:MAG: hypothetical protein RBR26_10800, partial [Methanosarcina mazei]|nr:hypothetical protein [Methanosarcina mazei]